MDNATGLLIKSITLKLLFLVPLISQASETSLPDLETMSRLRLGEIVVETTHLDQKGGAIKASLMIWAPVEDIWATVYSCKHAFVFLEGLEICEVIEDDGLDTITRQVINKGWPVPRQDYSFRTHRVPFTRSDIQLVEGTLEFMQASWEFIKLPEVIVVVYKVRVQPNFPSPRFLVRRTLRKGTFGLLACVRGLAGGSMSAEGEKEDLDQCPGDRESVD
jgi:hypothetical protein